MSAGAAATVILLGMAGLLASRSTAQAAEVTPMANGKLAPQQVRDLAASIITDNNLNVAPDMAAAIAIIESGDVTFPGNGCNPLAIRYEAGIGDSSAGLMQVLSGTARWLVSIGYDAYGDGNLQSLYDPATSMYFGLAYLDWLSKYNNVQRSQNYIVQSYNAGPGHSSTAYLAKYLTALAWLQQNGV